MKIRAKKEFLGQEFSYSTIRDPATGALLWTMEIDKKFSRWLHDLKMKNRELFKVQYSLSTSAYKALDHLKETLGVYDDSLIVRAMTITFINHLDTRKGKTILNKLNQLKNSPDLAALQQGETLKKNLYFSPGGMRDIESYSKLTGLKKSALLQNALYSTLLLSTQEDPEIKKFWDEVILSQIVVIAKAA